MSDISAWSTTAASNNSASPDGFPEGMAPSGTNDSAREVMAAVRAWYEEQDYIDYGDTPAYASGTTFTISGNVTAQYTAGRPIKITDASTLYGHIVSSSYGAPNTTVTVKLKSGSVTGAISAVAVGPFKTQCFGVVPAGGIISWVPGYFADGSNGTYTGVLPSANTVAAANAYLNPLGWYVCDGSELNESDSQIFNGAGRYLPNLTDDRFLMGDTVAGGIGGSSTMEHTHEVTTNDHTHAGPSHNHKWWEWTDINTQSTTYSSDGSSQALGQTLNNVDSKQLIIFVGAGAADYAMSNDAYTNNGGTGATGLDGGETVTSDTASNTENRPKYLSCFYIMRVK